MLCELRETTCKPPTVLVTLDYQRKGSRVYLEWTSDTNLQTAGVDSEVVRGSVVAADVAAARSVYQSQVRASYAGRYVRDEVTTETRQSLKLDDESGFNTQEIKLDFSFAVYKAKASGRVGVRYGISVARDFLNCEMSTSLEGSIFALDEAAAETLLGQLLSGMGLLGSNTRSNRWQSFESDGASGAFLERRFEEKFVSSLSGVNGILECQVSEDVKYSGPRNVIMPVLNGVSIVQNFSEILPDYPAPS